MITSSCLIYSFFCKFSFSFSLGIKKVKICRESCMVCHIPSSLFPPNPNLPFSWEPKISQLFWVWFFLSLSIQGNKSEKEKKKWKVKKYCEWWGCIREMRKNSGFVFVLLWFGVSGRWLCFYQQFTHESNELLSSS